MSWHNLNGMLTAIITFRCLGLTDRIGASWSERGLKLNDRIALQYDIFKYYSY